MAELNVDLGLADHIKADAVGEPGNRTFRVRAVAFHAAQEPPPEGNADLLTVGLVVFFVALIVVVAALLIAPTLL